MENYANIEIEDEQSEEELEGSENEEGTENAENLNHLNQSKHTNSNAKHFESKHSESGQPEHTSYNPQGSYAAQYRRKQTKA